MSDVFLNALNASVAKVFDVPRVRFDSACGPDATRWLHKKHGDDMRHEPATIAAYLAIAEAGNIPPPWEELRIWDCGALYGYFSLVAKQVFPGAQITAFDAHPAAIRSLVANLLPTDVVVFGVVTDECREDAKFWLSGFNLYEEPAGGWEKLADEPGAMKERGENNRGRGFAKADFFTLDAYAEKYGAPHILKIDVEGYQAKAIRGASHILETVRPYVIIELHDPEKLARFGVTNAETVRPLFDLGYRAYWCPNFRARDASFEAVPKMTEQQEQLCLMVFAP